MENLEPQGKSFSNQLLLSFFQRQLSIFATMDLVLILFTLAGLLIWAEHWTSTAVDLIDQHGIPSTEVLTWSVSNPFQVYDLEREPEGVELSWIFSIPENTRNGLRNFSSLPLYTTEFYHGTTPYAVVVNLHTMSQVLKILWGLLLLCQGISLFFNMVGTAQAIHQTLSPIQDLADTTVRLNTAGQFSKEQVAVLEGELRKIDASDLDSRIDLPNTQRELQALAQAINEMLDRLSEAYSAQMRFVSDASHELRTPIAVIEGYSAMLNRWGKFDETALQEGIDAIHSESKSMERLVEQLLFLARGDNLSQPVTKEVINLVTIAKQVVKEEEMLSPDRLIERDWSEQIMVSTDPALLKQVLRILMENSLKYSQETIWLRLKQGENQVEITIEDEGVGIPTESIPHIFERFYRSDRSRTRQTGGTGLGLSIALWIAEQHDGWFDVVSREGIGTRITLVIPIKS